VAGFGECSDEPLGSGAMELVSYNAKLGSLRSLSSIVDSC
jgi:hypothetical protein